MRISRYAKGDRQCFSDEKRNKKKIQGKETSPDKLGIDREHCKYDDLFTTSSGTFFKPVSSYGSHKTGLFLKWDVALQIV